MYLASDRLVKPDNRHLSHHHISLERPASAPYCTTAGSSRQRRHPPPFPYMRLKTGFTMLGVMVWDPRYKTGWRASMTRAEHIMKRSCSPLWYLKSRGIPTSLITLGQDPNKGHSNQTATCFPLTGEMVSSKVTHMTSLDCLQITIRLSYFHSTLLIPPLNSSYWKFEKVCLIYLFGSEHVSRLSHSIV